MFDHERRELERALKRAVNADDRYEIRKLKEFDHVTLDDYIDGTTTALQMAAVQGSDEVVEELISQGADIKKANNQGNGETPLHLAIQHQRTSTAALLRKLGASLGTEQMVLVTVDDVVRFFEVIGVLPEHMVAIGNNLRVGNVDAAKLWAVPNASALVSLLPALPARGNWGLLFYGIVQEHRHLQGVAPQQELALAVTDDREGMGVDLGAISGFEDIESDSDEDAGRYYWSQVKKKKSCCC